MLEAEIVSRLVALSSLKTESVRAVRREFSGILRNASPEMVVELAYGLLARTKGVYRVVACELVHYHQEALRSLNAKKLERLGRGIDNWGAVDTFACYLAGPSWREHQVPDSLILRWARSKDRWWRRAALVSTVPLNSKARGGTGDPLRTVKVCEMLIEDRDDMVVKALSWALRELSKRDREAVRDFVRKHQNLLAPRVVREVRAKLQTGLKNPPRSR